MSYAVMAHVTDYDVWHESEQAVTVEMVIRTLHHNADVAKAAVAHALQMLRGIGPSPTPMRWNMRSSPAATFYRKRRSNSYPILWATISNPKICSNDQMPVYLMTDLQIFRFADPRLQ
ncbi:MAG: hypothetical protein R2867_42650 [Caldilineaceae bacterium]